MWPFDSYPESSPERVHGKTYDYVIVGGGTAGCALASRLSENPDVSVLLLERGHVKDTLMSRMPVPSQNMWWTELFQVQNTIWTEPIQGANKRKNRLWAVNGIGGASRLNAMLWTRGSPVDYAAWSEIGLEDWAWDKVEPYFKRLENVTWLPNKSQSQARGRGGPITLCRPLYPFEWPKYLEKAAQSIGIPIRDDCNDPRTPSCGYFTLDTAIDKKGKRVSALSAYLNKSITQERSQHLTICTGTVASRLEITGNDRIGHTVTGVHIRHSSGPDITTDYFVRARKEVIVTCGAINTPQLLLLSGIGPKLQNASESQLHIPSVKELPAVGANFSDHYSIPIMLELPREETLHVLETALWGLWYIIIWVLTGRGLMSVSTAPTAIFLHTDSISEESLQISKPPKLHGCPEPNIEIMIIPLNSLERSVPGRSLFSIYPTIVQPQAKGCLEITSTDPLVNPRITHPMLGHIDDLKAARIAVRVSMRLADEFQNIYPFSAPFAFAPGNELQTLSEWEQAGDAEMPSRDKPVTGSTQANKTWKNVTDTEIDEYIRRVAHTALHFCSTCPMGTNEMNGVVDQKLMVFGFRNLRIADASVFPKITSAHTMAPVLMVAERCSDFIKSTWYDSVD